MAAPNKVFKHTSCEAASTDDGVSDHQVRDNIPALAEAMGLDESCKEYTDTSSTSWSASMSGSVLGGLVGAGSQLSGSTLNDKKRTSGCGNFLVDSKDILTATRNMNCVLNKTTSEQNVAVSAGATVLLQVVVPKHVTDDLRAQSKLYIDAMQKCTTRECREAYKGVLKDIHTAYSNIGRIKIDGATIEARVSTNIKTCNNLSVEQKEELRAEYKTVANAMTDNILTRKLGTNALQGNARTIVQNKLTTLDDKIDERISDIVNTSGVTKTGTGNVTIKSPMSLEIVDSTISSNVVIDIVSSSLTRSAMDLAKLTSQDILKDVASTNLSELDVAGLDDLEEVKWKGIADAIKSAVPSFDLSTEDLIMVAIILVAVIGLVVFVKYGLLGKKSKSRANTRGAPAASPQAAARPMGAPDPAPLLPPALPTAQLAPQPTKAVPLNISGSGAQDPMAQAQSASRKKLSMARVLNRAKQPETAAAKTGAFERTFERELEKAMSRDGVRMARR